MENRRPKIFLAAIKHLLWDLFFFVDILFWVDTNLKGFVIRVLKQKSFEYFGTIFRVSIFIYSLLSFFVKTKHSQSLWFWLV